MSMLCAELDYFMFLIGTDVLRIFYKFSERLGLVNTVNKFLQELGCILYCFCNDNFVDSVCI